MGADNSYILYSDTTGRRGVGARVGCTWQDLSVFSRCPQPGRRGPASPPGAEDLGQFWSREAAPVESSEERGR